jgi:hypothetical protein
VRVLCPDLSSQPAVLYGALPCLSDPGYPWFTSRVFPSEYGIRTYKASNMTLNRQTSSVTSKCTETGMMRGNADGPSQHSRRSPSICMKARAYYCYHTLQPPTAPTGILPSENVPKQCCWSQPLSRWPGSRPSTFHARLSKPPALLSGQPQHRSVGLLVDHIMGCISCNQVQGGRPESMKA